MAGLVDYSSDEGDGCPLRRWEPKSNLPTVPGAGSMSLNQVRERFSIPNNVEISRLSDLSDPIGEDEAAVSFAQLEYGLTIPIELCSLLSLWGAPLSQVHPSILIAIRRIHTIVSVFNLPFDASDMCRIFLPSLRTSSNGKKSYFICSWRDPKRRLTEFPHNFDGWTRHCFKLKNWQSNPHIHIPHKLAVETPQIHIDDDAGSTARLDALFGVDSRLLRVSFPESYVRWFSTHEAEFGRPLGPFPAVPLSRVPLYPYDEDFKADAEPMTTQPYMCAGESSKLPKNDVGSTSTSSSAGMIRIPRKGKNHLIGSRSFRTPLASNHVSVEKRIHKRLNKGPRKRKTPLVNANITDALSRKDCNPVRRSSRVKPVINYAESKLFKACVGRGGNVADDSSESEKGSFQSASDDGVPSVVFVVDAGISPNEEWVMDTEFSYTIVDDLNISNDDAPSFNGDIPFAANKGEDKFDGAATSSRGKKPAPPVLDISDSDSSKLVLGCSLVGVKRKRVPSPSNDEESALVLAQKIHDQLGTLIARLRGDDNPSHEELMREVSKLRAEKIVMSDEITSLTKEAAVAQEKSDLYREQVKVILHHYSAEPSMARL